jgi:nucleoid DNA-binding protein
MDINLFSKCIKDLIVENERVDVPFLGSFVAEMQPATYSDRQTTIHPPYRKMTFHKEDVSLEQGKLLLEKVMQESDVSLEQAGVELGWCLSRLSSELEGHKSCKLPGLGVMRANARNEYFFVPDDQLDIWPDGVGFEPISIKVSEEIPGQARNDAWEIRKELWETRHDVASEAASGDRSRELFSRAGRAPEQRSEPVAPKPEPELKPEPEPKPKPEPEPAPEPTPEPTPKAAAKPSWLSPDAEDGLKSRKERQLRIARLVLVILGVLLVLFIVAAYLFTDELSPILDRLLYTKEELELLRR